MSTVPRLLRVLLNGVAASLVLSAMFSTQIGTACETPVYRYAMYRWQPTPYEVYFLHRGEPGPEHQAVRSRIEELADGSENRANVAYLPVNLDEDPDLLSVPPDVKQAWTESKQQAPGYLVSTPYGASLHTGEMDEASAQALAESPARKSLATQLEAGKVGVFVLLKSADKGANEGAQAILKDVLDDVSAGKVSLYVPPADGGEEAESSKAAYELGLIEIDRSSEEEAWFVKSLLAVEPDLQKEERPMVFLIYGRARALLPYIGKGISRENLLREVEFISGACSCTVKEQNPGVDLLVRYDWEAAAAAIAERVGSEEGNESVGSDMFFPELIIPSTNTAAADNADASDADTVDEAEAVEADDETLAAANTVASASPESLEDSPAVAAAGEEVASASPQPEAAEATALSEKADFSIFAIVGGGLVVSLVVLFGVTLLVLRPQ